MSDVADYEHCYFGNGGVLVAGAVVDATSNREPKALGSHRIVDGIDLVVFGLQHVVRED